MKKVSDLMWMPVKTAIIHTSQFLKRKIKLKQFNFLNLLIFLLSCIKYFFIKINKFSSSIMIFYNLGSLVKKIT